jgi:hypothetical protein
MVGCTPLTSASALSPYSWYCKLDTIHIVLLGGFTQLAVLEFMARCHRSCVARALVGLIYHKAGATTFFTRTHSVVFTCNLLSRTGHAQIKERTLPFFYPCENNFTEIVLTSFNQNYGRIMSLWLMAELCHYDWLEISTRGHEYEKGYWIKNVIPLFRIQFPGKQQCWC